MRVADVEDAVLSSFLFAPMMSDMENLFKLNEDYFTTKFRKRMANNINKAINNETLGMLDTEIEEKVSGTKYELPYLEVLAQSPMPVSLAKKYHDDFLMKKYNSSLIKGGF